MKRKAFLIAAPFIKGRKGYLPGVTPDIVNMEKILKSEHGGAWNSDEIVVFQNPTKLKLQREMNKEQLEFAIVQYSGHGFEQKQNDVFLEINPSESVSLSEIDSWIECEKSYYFLDCCRVVIPPVARMEAIDMKGYILETMDSERESYREKYDKIIGSCDKGTSIIYSCSDGESADEDRLGRGGIFSFSYFNTANDIIKELKNSPFATDEYYSIEEIFSLAVDRMYNDYPMAKQVPEMKPERRKFYFPFLV